MPRIQSIDVLRGLVIVLMAIDHTRDFVHSAAMDFQPENLARTNAPIFFTRWITHFCAPVFMFCAGLGAYLRRTQAGELSRFLWTRGLWLIVLEITLVRLGFFFNVTYDVVFLLVFWALGLSMIVLAVLVRLPFAVILAIGLAMIGLHNLLDGIRPASFGAWAPLWNVLHQPGLLMQTPLVIVGYPLIPWIGVMAVGYCCGRVYSWPVERRQRFLIYAGLVMIVAFVALRTFNVYGDPRHWAPRSSLALSAISFLNTTKYPPSLLFLLMTLGPALLFLGVFDRLRVSVRNPLLVFGRVPLLFFVAHLPLIHAIAIGLTAIEYGNAPFLFTPPPTLGTPRNVFPADYGWDLWVTYVVWLGVLALMDPLCAWFARQKATRRGWVWSYL